MAYGSGRVFRRSKGGNWYIAYMVHGAEVKESAKSTDRRVAVDLLEARKKAVRAGQVVDRSGEKQTVADLLDKLDAYHEAKDRQRVPYAIAALKDAFGWIRAMELTTDDVRAAVLQWKSGKAPATINRRLAALSKAYNLSLLPIDKRRLNIRGEILREDNARTQRVPVAKKKAFVAALPAYLRDFWTVADLTGKRRGQLAWTTWDDNYDAATNTLHWRGSDTKSRHEEVLPLAGKVGNIIKRLYRTRRAHCPFAFHGEDCKPGHKPSKRYGCIGDGKKAFATAAQAAGLPWGRKNGGICFHSTRVNFVSEATERGVPAHVIMAITGHRTRSVFDHYHLTLSGQIRDALR